MQSNFARKSAFTRRCAVIFQQHSKQGLQHSSYEANNFVYFCQQLSTLGNIDKGYHGSPLHTAFRLLKPSVSLLPGFLSGEQPQLTGCGLCRPCCHWLWARACVIFCGTFASSTLDSVLVLPTAHNYIMSHKKWHVCLFAMLTVGRGIPLHSEEFPVCHERVLPLPVSQDRPHKSDRCWLP